MLIYFFCYLFFFLGRLGYPNEPLEIKSYTTIDQSLKSECYATHPPMDLNLIRGIENIEDLLFDLVNERSMAQRGAKDTYDSSDNHSLKENSTKKCDEKRYLSCSGQEQTMTGKPMNEYNEYSLAKYENQAGKNISEINPPTPTINDFFFVIGKQSSYGSEKLSRYNTYTKSCVEMEPGTVAKQVRNVQNYVKENKLHSLVKNGVPLTGLFSPNSVQRTSSAFHVHFEKAKMETEEINHDHHNQQSDMNLIREGTFNFSIMTDYNLSVRISYL